MLFNWLFSISGLFSYDSTNELVLYSKRFNRLRPFPANSDNDIHRHGNDQ
jgi:hypothetical protein